MSTIFRILDASDRKVISSPYNQKSEGQLPFDLKIGYIVKRLLPENQKFRNWEIPPSNRVIAKIKYNDRDKMFTTKPKQLKDSGVIVFLKAGREGGFQRLRDEKIQIKGKLGIRLKIDNIDFDYLVEIDPYYEELEQMLIDHGREVAESRELTEEYSQGLKISGHLAKLEFEQIRQNMKREPGIKIYNTPVAGPFNEDFQSKKTIDLMEGENTYVYQNSKFVSQALNNSNVSKGLNTGFILEDDTHSCHNNDHVCKMHEANDFSSEDFRQLEEMIEIENRSKTKPQILQKSRNNFSEDEEIELVPTRRAKNFLGLSEYQGKENEIPTISPQRNQQGSRSRKMSITHPDNDPKVRKHLTKLIKKRRHEHQTNLKNKEGETSKKKEEEEVLCSICFAGREDIEELAVLPCKHNFCAPCIKGWAEQSNICPNCKQKFNEIRKFDKEDKMLGIEKIKDKEINPDELEEDDDEDYQNADDYCYACLERNFYDMLLICEHCKVKCCHMFCLQPVLDELPFEPWYCDFCVTSFNIATSLPISNRFQHLMNSDVRERNMRQHQEIDLSPIRSQDRSFEQNFGRNNSRRGRRGVRQRQPPGNVDQLELDEIEDLRGFVVEDDEEEGVGDEEFEIQGSMSNLVIALSRGRQRREVRINQGGRNQSRRGRVRSPARRTRRRRGRRALGSRSESEEAPPPRAQTNRQGRQLRRLDRAVQPDPSQTRQLAAPASTQLEQALENESAETENYL